MPQAIDHLTSTLSTTVDAITTSWTLVDASSFPDPANGQYWVWCWDKATNPNPADDSNLERVRVTAKSGNVLTVVRGEAGQTASGHSSTHTVAMLADVANIESVFRYNPIHFGADPTGTADSKSALENCFAAAVETGIPVHLPRGTYKVSSKIQWTAASGTRLEVFGDGYENSEILDDSATSSIMEFNDDFISIRFTDIGFRQTATATSKESHFMLSLNNATANHIFTRCQFHGGSQVQRGFVDLTNTWNVTFRDCIFSKYNGIAIRQTNNTNNGGNLTVADCYMEFGRVGVFSRGNSVNNNVKVAGTKFAYNQGGDWMKVTDLSTWTFGATVIDIGSGHGTVNQTAIVIANDLRSECHIIKSYNDSTGDATLSTSLENDWSSDTSAEMFVGSFSVVTGNKSKNLQMSLCQLENAPAIVNQCTAAVFDCCNYTHWEATVAGKFDLNQTPTGVYSIYIVGHNTRETVVIAGDYSTDRSDEYLGIVIDAYGDSDQPGPPVVIGTVKTTQGTGAEVVVPEPFNITGSTTIEPIVIVDGNIYLGGAEISKSATAGGNVVRIPYLETQGKRVLVPYDAADNDYTVQTSDEVIVMNTHTTTRTITLPASPEVGRRVLVVKTSSAAQTLTVDRNGKLINGATSNISTSTHNDALFFLYVGGGTEWKHWKV